MVGFLFLGFVQEVTASVHGPFLQRGRFDPAREALHELEVGATPAERVELESERARLLALQGRHEAAITAADRAFSLSPSLVTQATLHQLRSLSHFELGRWSQALHELESVDSLGTVLPDAIPAFYGQVTRARILARDQGLAAARERMRTLWKGDDLTPDRALTLLRAEIDLGRLAGSDTSAAALACHAIASRMGDALYEALALLDLYCSLPTAERARLEIPLARHRREFERVDALFREAFSDGERISTTGLGLRNAARGRHRAKPLPADLLAVDRVVLASQARILHLQPEWRVTDLGRQPQLLKAIALIAEAPRTREEIHRAIWGHTRYSPELHDSLISTLLHRIRREAHVPVRMHEGLAALERTERVDTEALPSEAVR